MNKVGKFEKVSFNEFKKSFDDEKKAKEIYDLIKLPKRATTGSAGYDFYAPMDICLHPQESILVPTGIRCKIEDGWMLALFPRSGLGTKFRLQLNNTVGIVDADYYFSDNEGHMFAKITNDGKEGKTIDIKQGQGFMQGVFIPFGITVDDDAKGVRNGGFGSTTK